MSGTRNKNVEIFFIIEAKNAVNSQLLASFLTTIWEILTLFIRVTISCKGLYNKPFHEIDTQKERAAHARKKLATRAQRHPSTTTSF